MCKTGVNWRVLHPQLHPGPKNGTRDVGAKDGAKASVAKHGATGGATGGAEDGAKAPPPMEFEGANGSEPEPREGQVPDIDGPL